MIFFYDVLFEVLGGGRTPGKRLNGLRVVRTGGRPITLVRSALRNILRLIDILPGFYAVGMTTIFITPQQPADRRPGGGHLRGPRPPRGPAARPRDACVSDVDPGPAADLGRDRRLARGRRRRARVPRAPLRSCSAESRDAIAARARLAAAPARRRAPPNLGDERFLELLVAAKAARG